MVAILFLDYWKSELKSSIGIPKLGIQAPTVVMECSYKYFLFQCWIPPTSGLLGRRRNGNGCDTFGRSSRKNIPHRILRRLSVVGAKTYRTTQRKKFVRFDKNEIFAVFKARSKWSGSRGDHQRHPHCQRHRRYQWDLSGSGWGLPLRCSRHGPCHIWKQRDKHRDKIPVRWITCNWRKKEKVVTIFLVMICISRFSLCGIQICNE